MQLPTSHRCIPVGRTLIATTLLALIGTSAGYFGLAHLDRHYGIENAARQETLAGPMFRIASVEQAR